MRSAEEWLAARGVERREIRVRLDEPAGDPPRAPLGANAATPPDAHEPPGTERPAGSDHRDEDPGRGGADDVRRRGAGEDDHDGDEFDEGELDRGPALDLAAAAAPLIPLAEPGRLRAVPDPEPIRSEPVTPQPAAPVHAQEARRVARAVQEEEQRRVDLAHHEPRERPSLGDDAASALAYVRRATANTPMSEGRLRQRLLDRNHPAPAVEVAMRRARDEGIVDDVAFAGALVQEWHAKGHAAARIRQDLWQRGFDRALIDRVLATTEQPDPEAAAFAIARAKASSLRSLDAEVAFRRLVSHLARRGHGEGLARKVARQVLWADREQERRV